MKKKPKRAHTSHFGRCTAEDRAECTVCSDKGKLLCEEAAFSLAKGPRKGPQGKDDRPFTPIPHEALRWNLGRDFDGVHRTYVYLVSWTTEHTNLVYKSAENLAIGRGITVKSLYEHLRTLVDLKLISKVPRMDVYERSRKGQEAYYVLPLPKWVVEIAELSEELTNNRLSASELAQVNRALKSRRKVVLLYLKNRRDSRSKK